MDLVTRHALLDDALEGWAAALGRDRARYVGHAYRVFNFARRIRGTEVDDDALAVASAFHDVGIWSDKTFDYLAPSARRARDYLADRAGIPADVVVDVIANHHAILPVRGSNLVEAFRLADRVDVSAGLLRGGLDRAFVREVVAAFPFAGFHGMLVRTALGWLVSHPLRPLPMMRWRGVLTPPR